MTSYVAHFLPHRIVDGVEVQAPLLGPQEWDCTAFVAEYGVSRFWRDQDGWLWGPEARLKADLEAPAWVREWRGPYAIAVHEV